MAEARETLSVTAAGARGIARLVADAAHGSEVTVTRHGTPIAAVVGIAQLEELERLRDDLRDLALAVIDEQHRFGVEQRLALAEKGNRADTLLMSATPIPRTLMMTAYGDLDVSRLTEKPPGRQPVDTRAVPLDRFEEVSGGVARA